MAEPGRTIDYYLAKGLLERLEAGLGYHLEYTPAEERFLHPGKSAYLHTPEGRFVGWVGEVHPLVAQGYDLRSPTVVAAELDLDVLLEAAPSVRDFRDLLAYPVVEQDFALVVDAGVPASVLRHVSERRGGSYWRRSRSSTSTKAPRLAQARRAWLYVLASGLRTAPQRREVNELRTAMWRRSLRTGSHLRT